MSYLGKDIRLSRLLNDKSGHLLAITVDHSISRGIFENLMPIDDVIAKIVAGKPDSLTMHKGIAQNCFAPFAGKTSLILKASSFSPYQPTMDTQTADVEEAVRLGADAVSMGLILGGEFQPQQVYALEDEYRKKTDEELRQTTVSLREKLAGGATLDDILPDAFAA